jgi:hypothetical protein
MFLHLYHNNGANTAEKQKREVIENGPVVQLVRMPPCHGGGRGFESRPDRKKPLRSNSEGLFCFQPL